MNDETYDEDDDYSVDINDISSHDPFDQNDASPPSFLLRSRCFGSALCQQGHGLQFHSRISPSPSRSSGSSYQPRRRRRRIGVRGIGIGIGGPRRRTSEESEISEECDEEEAEADYFTVRRRLQFNVVNGSESESEAAGPQETPQSAAIYQRRNKTSLWTAKEGGAEGKAGKRHSFAVVRRSTSSSTAAVHLHSLRRRKSDLDLRRLALIRNGMDWVNEPRTGYTYSDSPAYRDTWTPDRETQQPKMPNMARRSLLSSPSHDLSIQRGQRRHFGHVYSDDDDEQVTPLLSRRKTARRKIMDFSTSSSSSSSTFLYSFLSIFSNIFRKCLYEYPARLALMDTFLLVKNNNNNVISNSIETIVETVKVKWTIFRETYITLPSAVKEAEPEFRSDMILRSATRKTNDGIELKSLLPVSSQRNRRQAMLLIPFILLVLSVLFGHDLMRIPLEFTQKSIQFGVQSLVQIWQPIPLVMGQLWDWTASGVTNVTSFGVDSVSSGFEWISTSIQLLFEIPFNLLQVSIDLLTDSTATFWNWVIFSFNEMTSTFTAILNGTGDALVNVFWYPWTLATTTWNFITHGLTVTLEALYAVPFSHAWDLSVFGIERITSFGNDLISTMFNWISSLIQLLFEIPSQLFQVIFDLLTNSTITVWNWITFGFNETLNTISVILDRTGDVLVNIFWYPFESLRNLSLTSYSVLEHSMLILLEAPSHLLTVLTDVLSNATSVIIEAFATATASIWEMIALSMQQFSTFAMDIFDWFTSILWAPFDGLSILYQYASDILNAAYSLVSEILAYLWSPIAMLWQLGPSTVENVVSSAQKTISDSAEFASSAADESVKYASRALDDSVEYTSKVIADSSEFTSRVVDESIQQSSSLFSNMLVWFGSILWFPFNALAALSEHTIELLTSIYHLLIQFLHILWSPVAIVLESGPSTVDNVVSSAQESVSDSVIFTTGVIDESLKYTSKVVDDSVQISGKFMDDSVTFVTELLRGTANFLWTPVDWLLNVDLLWLPTLIANFLASIILFPFQCLAGLLSFQRDNVANLKYFSDEELIRHLAENPKVKEMIQNSAKSEIESISRDFGIKLQSLETRLDDPEKVESLKSDFEMRIQERYREIARKLERIYDSGSAITKNERDLDQLLAEMEEKLDRLFIKLADCCKKSTAEFEEALKMSVISNVTTEFLPKKDLEAFRKRILDDSKASLEGEFLQDVRDRFREEIAKAAFFNANSDGNGIRHDENNALFESTVKKLIRESLQLYDADKTGQFDFALESAGAQVISTRCTENFVRPNPTWAGTLLSPFMSAFGKSNNPRSALQPGVLPGECWAFRGSRGHLLIQLSRPIIPTRFSLEHIPRSLSPNGKIDSAPKNFTVFGFSDDGIGAEPVEMGAFMYETEEESPALQFFPAELSSEHSETYFTHVELTIESNHGHVNYTCLYRFRVHGTPKKP